MLSLVFCFLARPEPSQVNFTKILGCIHGISIFLILGGPTGGSALGKVLRPSAMDTTWLVETEIAFSSRREILYRTKPGQIVAKMLGGFSGNYYTKMKISRDPV